MEQERYQILERLGMGGIGVVYKGFDRQLNRHVAIKRLMNRNEFANASAEEAALHKEASTLAAMRHPSIVTIFDVSSDEDGVFMVMELLEGDDLGHYLYREGPLPLADFEQLATQMLEALIAAHDMKLLHRDIKTENIRVQRALTGRFQCKLVDFGLARVSHVAMKQTVDQSGNILGSVSYMAPEQFVREPLDARTDLYALGCVFYEALAGKRAFDGPNVAAIMERHLQHIITPLHTLRPDAPPALCQWVEQFIQADRAARPASAQAALHSYRELLSGTPPLSQATPLHLLAAAPAAASSPTLPQKTLTGPRPPMPTSPGTSGVRMPSTRPTAAAPQARVPATPPAHASTPQPRGGNAQPSQLLIACASVVAVLALIFLTYLYQTGALTPWEPLFNGTDLTGWTAKSSNWTVENGALRGVPGTNNSKDSLDSERKFTNFIVQFEFTVSNPSGNSGIILPSSLQCDIGPKLTGVVYTSNSGLQKPPLLVIIPDPQPDVWHTYRVTVRNARTTVVVDGQVTADFQDPRALAKPFTGPIRFEGSEHIRIRNVKIKEL